MSPPPDDERLARRAFLKTTLATSTLLFGAGCAEAEEAAPSAPLDAPPFVEAEEALRKDGGADASTPSCEETEDDPLGPYYRPGAPTRTSLVTPGMRGYRLVVEGRIRAAGGICAGLGGATVDVWQADHAGAYDLVGDVLRGVFVADGAGAYRVETIVPGRYLDGDRYRPRHLHVIVRAPGRPPLVTQLYFAGDPYNASDGMFKPSLALEVRATGLGSYVAAFDFVLR